MSSEKSVIKLHSGALLVRRFTVIPTEDIISTYQCMVVEEKRQRVTEFSLSSESNHMYATLRFSIENYS